MGTKMIVEASGREIGSRREDPIHLGDPEDMGGSIAHKGPTTGQ